MTQSTSKKTASKLFTQAQYGQVRGPRTPKRKRVDIDLEIQAKLRKIRDLHIKNEQHKATIDAALKKAKDEVAILMEVNNVEKLHCTGTNFSLQLKHRSNWTYSNDIAIQEKELKRAKEDERDIGIATNDLTIYTSVLIEK